MTLAAMRCAANDAEEAGLKLADETPAQTTQAERRLQVSLEPALSWVTQRRDGATRPAQRLSVDLAFQAPLAPDWRILAADRLDLNGPARLDGDPHATNTWKELYASGRLGAQDIVDFGRVNARLGVASGYNPTDYFRDRAVRSITSIDPASLRENRLGTVMLRGQHVWNGGSLTAILAPRLADGPNDGDFAADIGATNHRTRWLLSWSQRWAQDLSPQWLLYGDGEPGSSPQLGLNVTRLWSSACVAHLEWSGGRSTTLLAHAQQRPRDEIAFRTQWSAGGTCSNAYNMSLTLEFEHNGAALDNDAWRALRQGPLLDYAAYREQAQQRQDPPTRDGVFAFARWQNALMPRLDLSGFARVNLADRSRIVWLEARYRWSSTDLALQWQAMSGSALSEYGALPQRRALQLLLKHFF